MSKRKSPSSTCYSQDRPLRRLHPQIDRGAQRAGIYILTGPA